MQIYLLITDRCNLHCKMCIRGKQKGKDLDFFKLQSSIWIDELKNHDVVITGGEPTLHPEFCDIVNYLCTKAKTVTVTTNGTNNLYISKLLVNTNLYFQISIDGNKEGHNNIRGRGVYEKAISTIINLDNLNANYSVASVVNKYNTSSIKKLEYELRKLKNIRYWRLSYEMPFGDAKFEDMMSTYEWNKFVDEMIELARLRIKIKKIFPFDLYDKRKDDLDKILKKGLVCSNCGSGSKKIYIYPNLNVYSCTCLTDYELGNLEKCKISDILCGQKIKKFTEYNIKNKICLECKYLKYCNGGCIGMSVHYFKELGMGDIRCPKLAKNRSK